MRQQDKTILKIQIEQSIYQRIGSADLSDAAREIIKALAYACTFTGARKFSDIEMTSTDWNELADTLKLNELQRVVCSMPNYNPKYNRLFYILGCLARVYAARLNRPTTRQDYPQRRYTKAELRNVVTSIESMNADDL